MTRARRFFVRGRVQGVGFRYFVVERAGRLGLAGSTRNLVDGRVEVFAQGSPEALAGLLAALQEGPALSRVDGVEFRDVDPQPEAVGFRITH